MKWLNRLEEAVLAILLVAMTIIVFAEVLMRKMGFGLHWAGEVTLIINSWLVLIGASYCVREKAHICVDFITRKLNHALAKPVALVAVGFCLLYCAIFLYGSWVYVREDKIIGIELDDLPVQTWIPASILVIGFALLAYRFLQIGHQIWVKNDVHALSQIDEAEESMELAASLKRELATEEKKS